MKACSYATDNGSQICILPQLLVAHLNKYNSELATKLQLYPYIHKKKGKKVGSFVK